MAPQLTSQQQALLDCIRSWIAAHGYSPTIREIGSAVGLSSPSSVHRQLQSLARANVIQYQPGMPRTVVIVDGAS